MTDLARVPTDLARVRDWVRDGTTLFETTVAAVGDDELRAASTLPGWTRAHVVAHVARNADALVNLLTWARTGVPTPMYASPRQRAADIEAGARAEPARLRADLAAAHARLAAALDALPADRCRRRYARRGAGPYPRRGCRGCGHGRCGCTASTWPPGWVWTTCRARSSRR